jgi:2,3-bisphosphoglycerate-independent phosphoglycerate mutase
MIHLLFIFLDGVGLGGDDPLINPLARAQMPTLERLLGGRKLLASTAPLVADRATLLALDATLGVEGLPQSATGQAALLTGVNVPAKIGEHYGPKPNSAVAQILINGNLFSKLRGLGKSVSLLNAYPPRYFHGIHSGRRLFSSVPLAVTSAGVRLFDKDDFMAGRALSADLTGAGWVETLGFPSAPVRSPKASGELMAQLSAQYDFSLFEYWSTDYAGHRQDMTWAVRQLETLDAVLGSLLSISDHDHLVLITSDHGNMEDLSTRRHTLASVPLLLIGSPKAREVFTHGPRDLTSIAPAIHRLLTSSNSPRGSLENASEKEHNGLGSEESV